MSLWLPLSMVLALAPPDPAPIEPVAETPEPDPAVLEPALEPAPAEGSTVTEPTPEPAPAEGSVPREEPEMAKLLEHDEAPPAEMRRPVGPPPERDRVDRNERLRSYYASVFRPESNPARVWFAARAAYSLTGTSERVGGGRMGFGTVEVGQTWNFIGYGVGGTIMAGDLTFGDEGLAKSANLLVGGGPSLGLGRLGLLGRGYIDFRAGYNFFYAPVRANRAGMADPADAAPHGPKVQLDIGLLLHDSESRKLRHGFGATIGWQMLVHTFSGQFPLINSFNVGIGYFFG